MEISPARTRIYLGEGGKKKGFKIRLKRVTGALWPFIFPIPPHILLEEIFFFFSKISLCMLIALSPSGRRFNDCV